MTSRRQVRVAPSFFERLDELLPEHRSAKGDPSTTDFLLHEIPAIIDHLAEDFDSVTLTVEGVPGVRVLVTAGILVPFIAVYAVAAVDGAVDIIHLDIDDGGTTTHQPACSGEELSATSV